jgi:NAD(P)-dependent dehydrogenase (short-subunit alcohol dehydrogenase family)
MRLQNKVAIITGGGSGIGKATATLFAKEGAKLVLNGLTESKLTDTIKAIGAKDATHLAGDVSKAQVAQALVQKAVSTFGGVDILVNGVGVFKPMKTADTSEEDFHYHVDNILKSTWLMSKYAIPEMIKRGGGAIVNVGSMWALKAVAATPSAVYSAAKAGVHMLTKNMAIEYAADNIRANAVAPAVVKTPIYYKLFPAEQVPKVWADLTPLHPLGRVGEPEDVAELILYLASPEASWMTGQIIAIDGGVMAG